MATELKKVRDDFEKTVEKWVDPKNYSGALQRIYLLYQKFQTERFKTENASEGKPWPSLNKDYAEYKKKKFKSYPGSGSKMLIATSTLAGAVIGRGQHNFQGTDKHGAIFKKTSMEIYVIEGGTNAQGKPFTYPSHVAENRPFMEFSEAHLDQMQEELAKYVLGL